MASPNVKAVEELPQMVKDAVLRHLVAGTPLRTIAGLCGLSHMTLKRYRDEKILPHLDVLPEFGHVKPTPEQLSQDAENKRVIQSSVDRVVTACDKANAIGEVQAQVIALRERAKNVLNRVESRADEEFSGREWAAVATVVNRTLETQGRMTGELQDKTSAGDVNIQILMPVSSRGRDTETIDVDVIRKADVPRGTSE